MVKYNCAMRKSSTPCHEARSSKKNDCRRCVVMLGLMLVALPGLTSCMKFIYGTTASSTAVAIKHLQIGITAFEMDSAHFPIPKSDWHGPDVSLRTRGPIVPALLGQDATLNPKDVKFIDFPNAVAHKNGLWQDGAEWVISDQWGEPYYIVLDTNGDGKIANPEFGAEQSDAEYAKRCRMLPPPATLPLKVLIYSSGPDRDPKTWEDNVCSWR
jgi:hypothetical protein